MKKTMLRLQNVTPVGAYLLLALVASGVMIVTACGRGDAQMNAAQVEGPAQLSSGGGQGLPGKNGQMDGTGATSPSGGTGAGSGGSSATGGATASGGSPGGDLVRPPVRSSGCGTEAPYHGEKAFKIELPGPGGNATVRDYGVRAPQQADYDSSKPLPVIFVFHGAGGTNDFESMNTAAGGEAGKNAIFVAGQGIPYQSYGVGWDENCNGYDVAFFDAMLEQVAADFCVDRERIFATGYSWGADMSNTLGCCRGDVVRAVMPASGGEMLVGNTGECTEEISTFRITYGNADNVYSQDAFAAMVNFYKKAHGCSDSSTPGPEPTPSEKQGVCKTYNGCAKPVIECVYPVGHLVPEFWREDVWKFVSQF